MGGTWLTPRQDAYLSERIKDFLKAQRGRKLKAFWSKVKRDFFLVWRNSEEEEFEWDRLRREEAAALEAEVELAAAKGGRKKGRSTVCIRERDDEIYENEDEWLDGRIKQIHGFFYNRTSNSRKGKAKISFNLTPVIRAMGKVSEIQVYQRMYFDKRVKPKTDIEIEEKGIDKDHKLSYINMRTAEVYENETTEIRDIVRAEYEALEKEREDTEALLEEVVAGKAREYTPQEYILMQTALPEILKAVFEPLADKTGWTFAVLAGGPDPSLVNGECRTVSWYWGKTEDGDTFGDQDSSLKNVLPPFGTFCHHLFPEDVRLRRAVVIDEEADGAALAKAGRLEGFLEYVDGREVGEKAESDDDDDNCDESGDQDNDVPEPPSKAKQTKKPRAAPKAKGKGNGSSKAGTATKATKRGNMKKDGEGGAQKEVQTGKNGGEEEVVPVQGPEGSGDAAGVEADGASSVDGGEKGPISEYPFLTITPGGSNKEVEEIAQLLKEGEEAVKQKTEAERKVVEEENRRMEAVWGATRGQSAGENVTNGDLPAGTHQIILPPALFLDNDSEDPNSRLQFDIPNEDDPIEETPIYVPEEDPKRKRKIADEGDAEDLEEGRGRGKRVRKANRDLPDWVLPGRDWLLSGFDDTLWTECVQKWQNFEEMVMNPTSARIAAANCRPIEISKWLTVRKFTSIPDIPVEGMPDYAHRWIVWWNKLQPPGRAGEDGMLPPKLEREHESAMVGALKKSGEWGLYIVMVSLRLWADLRVSDERWHSAVKDLNDCFEMFLGMSK